jgi:hypothetical protein
MDSLRGVHTQKLYRGLPPTTSNMDSVPINNLCYKDPFAIRITSAEYIE